MTVAMETCGASHHQAREIQKVGHIAILLLAKHVRAYQRRQKNDYNDVQAVEACQYGTIRPVAVKTVDQQDIRKRMLITVLTKIAGILFKLPYQHCQQAFADSSV